jgi:hypothetical protein
MGSGRRELAVFQLCCRLTDGLANGARRHVKRYAIGANRVFGQRLLVAVQPFAFDAAARFEDENIGG